MATSFDATNAPFDRLTPQQIGAVEAALDIGYFRPGETLIARDGAPELAVRRHQGLRRGARRRRSRRVCAAPATVSTAARWSRAAGSNAFVAREETLCNLAPRDLILGSSTTTTASPPSSIARSRASSTRRRATRRRRASARCSARGCATCRCIRAVFIDGRRDDRERRRDDARDQDQRAVRARRRARRPADRHATSPKRRSSSAGRSTASVADLAKYDIVTVERRRFRLARAAAG